MQELRFAAVSTNRAYGERHLRVSARSVDKLADDGVDALSVKREGRAPTFSTLGRVDQRSPRQIERARQPQPQAGLIGVLTFNGAHRQTYGHKDTSQKGFGIEGLGIPSPESLLRQYDMPMPIDAIT